MNLRKIIRRELKNLRLQDSYSELYKQVNQQISGFSFDVTSLQNNLSQYINHWNEIDCDVAFLYDYLNQRIGKISKLIQDISAVSGSVSNVEAQYLILLQEILLIEVLQKQRSEQIDNIDARLAIVEEEMTLLSGSFSLSLEQINIFGEQISDLNTRLVVMEEEVFKHQKKEGN
jgi:chromosome segregation ATPase